MEPLTFYLRVVCLASIWLAMLATIDRPRCMWWRLYLIVAGLMAVTYIPEMPGWGKVYWPALLLVAALRGAAALEAIHYVSKDFKWWSRLTAGAMLAGVFYCAILWRLQGGAQWQVAVQMRRYMLIWTAAYTIAALLFLWSIGWLRTRAKAHALIVAALCLRQAAVASAYIFGPFGESVWRTVDQVATATDSILYLVSALWFFARSDRASKQMSRAALQGGAGPSSGHESVSVHRAGA